MFHLKNFYALAIFCLICFLVLDGDMFGYNIVEVPIYEL